MPSNTDKRKRKPPPGVILLVDMKPPPYITNIYGGEDMMDDPEVQEVLDEIDAADSEGE